MNVSKSPFLKCVCISLIIIFVYSVNSLFATQDNLQTNIDMARDFYLYGDYESAKDILKNLAANLEKTTEGESLKGYIYLLLSAAYEKQGFKKLAKEYYNKAKEIQGLVFEIDAEYKAILDAGQAPQTADNWCQIAPTLMQLKADSVNVMWEWKYPDSGRVEFDTDPNFLNRRVAYSWASRYIHKVRLWPLEPNTTYYYKVYDSYDICYNWEDVNNDSNKFTTAPDVGSHTPFSFCVYGDTRIRQCGSSKSYGTETSIKKVRDYINQQSPDFVVHLGDFDHTGRYSYVIRRYFNWHRPLWKNSPLLPTYGNHEFQRVAWKYETCYVGGTYAEWNLGGTNVDDYFTTNYDLYYATEYGNILLITLFIPYKTGGAVETATDPVQKNWLISTLSNAKNSGNFDFIFVSFHSPMITISDRPNLEDLYNCYHSIFKQYEITAVFQACEHHFEHIRHDNIEYFVSGGGGAPIDRTKNFGSCTPNHGVYVNHFADLDFIKVDINGTNASYKVFRVSYIPITLFQGYWECKLEYNENFNGSTPPRAAEMQSPEPGSALTDSTVTFEWDEGVGVEAYELWIGYELRGNDIFNQNSNGALKLTVNNLPLNVSKLYVTLRSKISGDWKERYYEYSTLTAITITNPNGNEEWELNETKNITWNSSGITGNVRLELYQYGEKLGNIVDACENDGSYSWVVGKYGSQTASGGPGYGVKVVSISSPSIYDFNDQSFSITPYIIVGNPSGGEDWRIGQTYFIDWMTGDIPSSANMNIKLIQYGNTYIGEIVNATPNDGTYNWTITRFTNGYPVEPGVEYFIRVRTKIDSKTIEGFSKKFTITGTPLPTIRITYPCSDETYYLSSPMSIEWRTIGISGDVSIDLRKSDDSGGYNITPATPYNSSPYNYTVSSDITPGTYFIRITKESTIENSGNFTISEIPEGEMTFTLYPTTVPDVADWTQESNIIGAYDGNKAEGLPTGTTFLTASNFRNWTLPAGKAITKVEYGILARFTDGVSGKARMKEVTHNETLRWLTFGLAWEWKDFDITSLEAAWTKAGVDALQVAVKRADDEYEENPNVNLRVGGIRLIITVDDPSITVTSPNGGETWELGSTHEVAWNARGLSNNLKITLWQGDLNLGVIGYDIDPAAGSFPWTVGQHNEGTASIGTGYKIKIKEIGTTVSDFSDLSFSIVEEQQPEPETFTLYPTTVPNVANWTQESNIIGEYDGNKAEGSPGGTTFLVATNFDNWTLPAGKVITKVEYGILARFTDGVNGKTRMMEITHNETQRWLTFGSTWEWKDFDITPLEALWTKAEVDALQVAVRRAYEDDPATANLRVGGIRLKVTVE